MSIVKKTTFPISRTVPLGQALCNLHDRFSAFLAPISVDIYLREKPIMGRFMDTDRLLRVAGISDVILWKFRNQQFFDIAPSSIKLIVAGNGQARKDTVASFLDLYVGPQEYATNDESDAVAIGIAFLIKEGYIDSHVEIQRKPRLKDRPKPKVVQEPKVSNKPDVKPEKKKRRRKSDPPEEPTPAERGYMFKDDRGVWK